MDMQHPGEMAGEMAAVDDPIARARALIPLLQQAAPRIDAARELPPDVLDGMFAAGLFRLLVPRSCGGAELPPATFVQCVEAIAMGDASAAWCMNQGAVSMMSAAYMPLAAARAAFGGERDVLAWGYGPNGRLVRSGSGWRVTGQWSFASGSRHSTWLGAHCLVVDEAGNPVPNPHGGKTWERTALFPRNQATIVDNWQVLGLRGTGSDTYSVRDLPVDDDHVISRDQPEARREPGTLYHFQMMQVYAAGFACVALGVARQALDFFIAMAKTKTPASSTLLRDNNTVQHIIGYSDARLKAARSNLLRLLEQTYDALQGDGELTLEQRIAIRQATTYAIHESRDVVTAIYHEAGSTAIFDSQPFERRLRDINAVSQQLQGRRAHFETVGQYLLGMDINARNV